jgi:hypothetical protein
LLRAIAPSLVISENVRSHGDLFNFNKNCRHQHFQLAYYYDENGALSVTFARHLLLFLHHNSMDTTNYIQIKCESTKMLLY